MKQNISKQIHNNTEFKAEKKNMFQELNIILMQSKVKQLLHSFSLNKDIKSETQAYHCVLRADIKEDIDLSGLMSSDKPLSN